MKKKRNMNSLALLLAALIWGSSFVVVKDVVDIFPPNLLMAIRFLVAGVILLFFTYNRLMPLDKKTVLGGALMGVLYFFAYMLQTIGITDTTPGKNAFLTAVYCVMVPFIFWMVDKKRPDGYSIGAAVICIIGIGLISLDGGLSMRMGDALSLACGVFYALHIVAVSKLGQKYDVLSLTTIQFAVAGVLSLVTSLFFETMPTQITTGSLLGLAYLIIMPTLVGSVLQNVGQRNVTPAAASILLSLESVFGVLFSVLFYHEPLNGKLIMGFVLVLFAVILSETKFAFLKKAKVSEVEEK